MRSLQFFCFLFFLFSFSTLQAQEKNKETEYEINKLIWKPFIESYNQLDAKAFNQLHTADVLRAGNWGLWYGEEYKERIRKSYTRAIKGKETRKIELRIDFRRTQEDISYETGFYKVTSKAPEGKERISYGYFHVLIKKVDGQWKIAQDWDDEYFNGKKITEQDFLKAKALIFNDAR